MTLNLPESSFINPPHEVEGTPKEARASFYELAKDKIKYLTWDEVKKWHKDMKGVKDKVTNASFVLGCDQDEDFGKENLID